MPQLYKFLKILSIFVIAFFISIQCALAVPTYPIEEAKPGLIPVNITIHLSSLIAIDSISESFEFAGYFQYSWKDEDLEDGVIKLDDIWHPSVECVNFIEYQAISTIAKVKDGVVTVQERFKLKNSTEFDFRDFPFDDQHLDVAIESLNDSNVYFIPGPFTYGADSFVNIGAWNILSTSRESLQNFFPPEDKMYSRLNYSLNVRRKPDYYVIKILVPIFCLTMGTIFSLFIPMKEFSTSVSSVLTLVLTGLTLWLLSSDSLPKTHQISRIDRMVAISVTIQSVVFFLILIFFQRGKRRSLLPAWIRNTTRYFLFLVYPFLAYLAIFI